jgi:hypothetical protein
MMKSMKYGIDKSKKRNRNQGYHFRRFYQENVLYFFEKLNFHHRLKPVESKYRELRTEVLSLTDKSLFV